MTDKINPNEILDALPLAAAWLKQGGTATTNGVTLKTHMFQSKYKNDPVGFVRDCFYWGDSEGLKAYQEEILAAIPQFKFVSVRMPRGGGKTTTLAFIILWFALTRDGQDWKIATTAGGWRQLEEVLWPEVHLWARMIKWEKVGREPFDGRTELLAHLLKLRTGRAFAAASNKPSLLEGTHAKHLMFICDEAKAVPDTIFNAIEGSFSGHGSNTIQEAFYLIFSTPGEPQGRFYAIQTKKPGYLNWWTKHVTIDECVDSGQIGIEYVEQNKEMWGEDSPMYRQHILGEFATDDEAGIIPLSWVEAAFDRWRQWNDTGRPGEFSGLGVDVGAGGDATVVAPLFGEAIAELKYLPRTEDTMQATARIERLYGMYKGESAEGDEPPIVVDSNGIGLGMYDRMKELELPVVAFVAQSKSLRREETWEMGFANKRSEAWWNVRELLDPKRKPTLCLPPDDRLLGDLCAPHRKDMTGAVGRIAVESKIDVRKRLQRSTDSADAVIQILYERFAGFSRVLAQLDQSVYDCPRCNQPVLDFGDATIVCQRCGCVLERNEKVEEVYGDDLDEILEMDVASYERGRSVRV